MIATPIATATNTATTTTNSNNNNTNNSNNNNNNKITPNIMTCLRKMSSICEQCVSEYDTLFYGSKSQFLFSKTAIVIHVYYVFVLYVTS